MQMLKEKPFLTPNDHGVTGTDDAVSIQNAIDAAAADATSKANTAEANAKAHAEEKASAAECRILRT